MSLLKNKKAAVEMSVGTIVTIVLLMTVLILGLILIRTIFSGAIENVNSIDQSVKNEINKLFSEENTRKIVVYPPTRQIVIQKGNQDYLGFAFSIRNVETTEGKFTYEVFVNDPDIRTKCNINTNEAERWIQVGRTGSIDIPPGSSMQDPEFVRFLIPDNAPPCTVRYGINVEKDKLQYSTTVSVDVKIESS